MCRMSDMRPCERVVWPLAHAGLECAIFQVAILLGIPAPSLTERKACFLTLTRIWPTYIYELYREYLQTGMNKLNKLTLIFKTYFQHRSSEVSNCSMSQNLWHFILPMAQNHSSSPESHCQSFPLLCPPDVCATVVAGVWILTFTRQRHRP